ncbi:TetR/AcrR family transcriptional regulator [Streptomyces spinosisporus]|jgi:AcrR family transcriptional regulator|uniref:TetR/AcrR family transcriptional regulator n=1 Tax=Streptomyces spinosisporus TaxID=2927582 RepID=A0ABS9XAG1_9ACTN|nr:TetR/AcrR family transcriptional regulator [Streptomyces spinosisporus]MCI3239078.1 TetR/AcrR family transcriptional regulator [Streptomyces spinosisporus]
MADSSTQVRPGGRSAKVRAAVHRAVAELLAEEEAEALTLPAVAARAGVHPTTLYRRWGSTAQLLNDVATSRFTGDLVVPDSGSLAGDLQRWLADVATDVADPDTLAIMRAAIGSGPAGGCACTEDRHRQLGAIIRREQDRGGAALDVESAADFLLGPLYYRAIFTPEPASPDWARTLVSTYLATLRTP